MGGKGSDLDGESISKACMQYMQCARAPTPRFYFFLSSSFPLFFLLFLFLGDIRECRMDTHTHTRCELHMRSVCMNTRTSSISVRVGSMRTYTAQTYICEHAKCIEVDRIVHPRRYPMGRYLLQNEGDFSLVLWSLRRRDSTRRDAERDQP